MISTVTFLSNCHSINCSNHWFFKLSVGTTTRILSFGFLLTNNWQMVSAILVFDFVIV